MTIRNSSKISMASHNTEMSITLAIRMKETGMVNSTKVTIISHIRMAKMEQILAMATGIRSRPRTIPTGRKIVGTDITTVDLIHLLLNECKI